MLWVLKRTVSIRRFQKNRLNETVLLSTHNIRLTEGLEINYNFMYKIFMPDALGALLLYCLHTPKSRFPHKGAL